MKTNLIEDNRVDYNIYDEPATATDDMCEATDTNPKQSKSKLYRNVALGVSGAAIIGAGVAIGAYADNDWTNDTEMPTPTDDEVEGMAEVANMVRHLKENSADADSKPATHDGVGKVAHREVRINNNTPSNEVEDSNEGNGDAAQHEYNLQDMEFSLPQQFTGNAAVYQTETQGFMIIDTNDDGFGDILIKGNQDLSETDEVIDIRGEGIEIGRDDQYEADTPDSYSDRYNSYHRDLPYDDDYDSNDDDIADMF